MSSPRQFDDTETEKPLPCPFCGGEVNVDEIIDGCITLISCNGEHCEVFPELRDEYRNEAIRRWNIRGPKEVECRGPFEICNCRERL